MLNKTLTSAIGCLCLLGLMACAPDKAPETNGDKTLNLTRLTNGDLEYCDEVTGECTTLPYDGDCAIIEITIDTASGNSCQTCILEDGTEIDGGCVDVSVECVLVTIPDPDCIVCAYVNGDVIFSTCTVADDDPECVDDSDCNDDATYGYCLDGQCIYEPGCLDDSDCPAGFACMFYFMEGDPDDNGDMPYWNEYGTCVPMEDPCESDADCGPEEYCMVECWDYDCYPGEYCGGGCEGVCVPFGPDPDCSNVECPPGTYCEMIEVPCWDEPGQEGGADFIACYEAYPECVPAFECTTDSDCWADNGLTGSCINGRCIFEDVDCDTRNAMCEMMPPICPDGLVHSVVGSCFGPCVEPEFCAPMECNDDFGCPSGFLCEYYGDCFGPDGNGDGFAPCFAGGYCVPEYTEPTCGDVVCGPGEHCEMQEVWCFTEPCDPIPVCVPDFAECYTNEDCITSAGDVGYCLNGYCTFDEVYDCNDAYVLCDMVAPECPDGMIASVVDGCYGDCVDVNLCMPIWCGWDEDCPNGFVCDFPIYNGPEGSAPLVAGMCVPESPYPTCDDVLCAPGEVCVMEEVYCITWPCPPIPTCVPVPGECYDDADCPADHFCALMDCADPSTGTDCMGGGVCIPIDPPPPAECYADSDCPPDMACEMVNCDPAVGTNCGGGGFCVPADPTPDCFRTGCSGQVCADQDIYTTCEWLPVYACYDDAACERQADGACGWTITDELAVCLQDNI